MSLGSNIAEVAYRGISAAWTIAAMVSIAGCYPPSNPPPIPVKAVVVDTLCELSPIHIRKGDVLTLDTADKIIKYNERGQKVCGWKP